MLKDKTPTESVVEDRERDRDKTPRLRELFLELLAEKEKLLEMIRPARETYEKLVNDPQLIEVRRLIKEMNPKLAAIDNELAGLTRALGSKGIKIEQGRVGLKTPTET
jgi:hypothetical protein